MDKIKKLLLVCSTARALITNYEATIINFLKILTMRTKK